MNDLGSKVRSVRSAEGLTLAQLGEKASLSSSYLSQVERGVTTPSLSRLARIAEALGVEVRYFFESDSTSPCVVRAGRGKRFDGPPGVAIELLTADPTGKDIQPYAAVYRPGAGRKQLSSYSGEGCGIVLEGQITVRVGEEVYVLEAGDSIHFDRNQPHSWHNQGDGECTVIWAISPPLSEAELE